MYKSLNKGIISARTGKNTVAIVGFSKSTRHLVPYEDTDTEIWGINDAYKVADFMTRWDRWFELHPLDYLANQDNTPRDAEHISWLKEKHDFPLYMQKKHRNMPASVKFPLDEVCKNIGKKYITSSFGFMFGLAMLEGFERIELYGFDMKTFTEYADQRPNTEYLIGLAEGRGTDVFIPIGSSLCKGKIYGYEELELSFRQEMEYMSFSLDANVATQTHEFHQRVGRMNTLQELLPEHPELKELLTSAQQAVEMQQAQINNAMGRQQMNVELMQMYDALKAKELNLKETVHG